MSIAFMIGAWDSRGNKTDKSISHFFEATFHFSGFLIQ
jgi:hypothetical protein